MRFTVIWIGAHILRDGVNGLQVYAYGLFVWPYYAYAPMFRIGMRARGSGVLRPISNPGIGRSQRTDKQCGTTTPTLCSIITYGTIATKYSLTKAKHYTLILCKPQGGS